MKKLWVSWSTGKDSAYALHKLKANPEFEIAGLFTTVNEDYGRVAMHSTRENLMRLQAEALGLPIELVAIPKNCTNEIYEARMRELIQKAKASGVQAICFGDLFLEDIRSYREKLFEGSGIELVFPLWGIPTSQLAQDIINCGIEAVLTCVDPKKLPPNFAGRTFTSQTLSELPSDVDPCGENGEFHTFVFASPDFTSSIPVSLGQVVERDGFVFADVVPAGSECLHLSDIKTT